MEIPDNQITPMSRTLTHQTEKLLLTFLAQLKEPQSLTCTQVIAR